MDTDQHKTVCRELGVDDKSLFSLHPGWGEVRLHPGWGRVGTQVTPR